MPATARACTHAPAPDASTWQFYSRVAVHVDWAQNFDSHPGRASGRAGGGGRAGGERAPRETRDTFNDVVIINNGYRDRAGATFFFKKPLESTVTVKLVVFYIVVIINAQEVGRRPSHDSL